MFGCGVWPGPVETIDAMRAALSRGRAWCCCERNVTRVNVLVLPVAERSTLLLPAGQRG